jgi:uncharacterized protein (TIGR01319 family)
MKGYRCALAAAQAHAPDAVLGTRRAVSSAGGGLRVAAVGLVEDLTAAAARQAALNAGARVELVLSGTLDDHQVRRLKAAAPDIILFAGGTDGGQRDRVIFNARRLIEASLPAFVVVACNAQIARRLAKDFAAAGIDAEAVANVMPRIGELEIEPARRAISKTFITHVIAGRGLSTGDEFLDMVEMPTPEAVLIATELLAAGPGTDRGMGRVAVIDVGGATTDIHSVLLDAKDHSAKDKPMLPMPPSVRTVEGDLGMRVSAVGVAQSDGVWLNDVWPAARGPVQSALRARSERPDFVPTDADGADFDELLATACAATALRRHCGELSTTVRHNSPPRVVPTGPDLRELSILIGTGGALVRSGRGTRILSSALHRQAGRALIPRKPRTVIDRSYIMASAGLLATIDPRAAFALLTRELGLTPREERLLD